MWWLFSVLGRYSVSVPVSKNPNKNQAWLLKPGLELELGSWLFFFLITQNQTGIRIPLI
jgi:hypothetical protein